MQNLLECRPLGRRERPAPGYGESQNGHPDDASITGSYASGKDASSTRR
jgi:hypothetical protein